jgi:general secretion pathway protein D
VVPDKDKNALLIRARPAAFRMIESALRAIDASPLQVVIEATIAEVTLNDKLQYGVQYYLESGNFSGGFNLTTPPNGATSAQQPNVAAGLNFLVTGSNSRVIINALSQITDVRVISAPTLSVLNNQTARLQVGDQVPVRTQQSQSTDTSGSPVISNIEYKDTGVILKVTPRVNRGGMVMMDISQEVSQVADVSASPVASPTIQQRKINSTVAVQDGETVVLGGLISDNQNTSRNGVPLLQDIPVLGNLFRDTGNNKTRTELLVLITPHVVDNVQKARKVTDELRHRLPGVQAVLDRAH